MNSSLKCILSAITLWIFNCTAATALPVNTTPGFYSHKSSWQYKRKILILNTGGETANAVVNIQLYPKNFDYRKAKSNGSDIRFSLNTTLTDAGMHYWTEKWNEHGNSSIWLQIPVLKARKNIVVFMFYGNNAAEAVSNGDNTFTFFDDFESGDYHKKWTNVSIGNVEERDGLLKLKETDGEEGIIKAKFELNGKMIVRTMYQREHADEHWTRAGIGGWNYRLCFGDHTDFAGTGANYLMIYDNNSLSSLKTAPLIKAANGVITANFRPAALWYDGQKLYGLQDNVKVSWPVANTSSALTLSTLDNDAWDNFAFITVSPYSSGEQTVVISKEKNMK